MPNVKKISVGTLTGYTIYTIVRRDADGYLLNDADGAFANAPADPYVALAEDGTIKGLYELSESRTAWNDGKYTVAVYQQIGGSPAPASDILIALAALCIDSDAEVTLNTINDKTINLPSDPADESAVEAAITAAESAIRGADSDTLKTLSDQIDGVATASNVWEELLSAHTNVGTFGKFVNGVKDQYGIS